MAAARRLSGASWRVAVRASSRLNVDSTPSTLQLSACQQISLCFCPAEIEQTSRSGREAGLRDDGVRDSCEPGSHLPPIVGWPESCFAIARRNGHLVRAGVSGIAGVHGNAGVCSDGMKNGVLPPGIVFQSRGLAAKAKKAKSKVEHSEPTEDIAATAKANAVKMMETALDVLSREHSKLRTGRASAGILDHITVEAHGVRTPLNHIAAVTVSGLQTLNVLPYDASMVKEVEKAILNSPMGLNPQVDGSTMTVPLPRGF